MFVIRQLGKAAVYLEVSQWNSDIFIRCNNAECYVRVYKSIDR